VGQFDTSLWEQALAHRKQQREATRRAMLEKAREVIEAVFAGTGVSHVYLCGSLLRPEGFDDHSDIDVAVAGLPEEALQVAVVLEELLDHEVDLIILENCRFRAQIEQEGLRVR